MSLPLFETLAGLALPRPVGVLQVGANYGQEMRYFLENGIAAGVFIEPLPEPYAHLSGVCRQIPDFVAVNTLCTDRAGERVTFHVASNGGASSSILKPANHLGVFDYVKFDRTVELVSSTLDDVTAFLSGNGFETIVGRLDLLYMDTQGAELKILMGGNRTLKGVKYIYTEVMRNELYEGQPAFSTLCGFLDAVGFTLNNVYFNREHCGDALFIRKDVAGLKH